jgi:hypothetical protein
MENPKKCRSVAELGTAERKQAVVGGESLLPEEPTMLDIALKTADTATTSEASPLKKLKRKKEIGGEAGVSCAAIAGARSSSECVCFSREDASSMPIISTPPIFG